MQEFYFVKDIFIYLYIYIYVLHVLLLFYAIYRCTTVIIAKVREVRENSTSVPYNALF